MRNIELSKLDLPSDIKKLSVEELEKLCKQIRTLLIKSVSKTGGHLSSNLGTVELTVALHKVFSCPDDKFVWDVGHQAYTHKILTGRLDRFDTLRQENGLSGFPKPSESKYDAFISGHSSTSVSAALGIATAMKDNNDNHHVIAVIGDGAFTGGLAYEGLNNAGKSNTNIIIVLNDNGMSISKNVGALAKYLLTLRTKQSYIKTKGVVENILDKTPVVGKPLIRVIKSQKKALKTSIVNSTMFEDFGFEFVGPVDGHNIESLISALQNAKAIGKPVFVHVNTKKGKGYTPAEENPSEFHGVGSFEIATGNPDVVASDSYSSEWGKELGRLADNDDRIYGITAAMKYGTGLQYFCKNHKNKFYDVGIAEQHAVTFSAGLATMGCIPVFCVYSSFLQRAYDQLIHDVSIDNEHIVLGIDRAGIVGEDGETHQGIFDIGFMTSIPNVTLYSPSNYDELRNCLRKAIYDDKGIVGVRYPRGSYKADDYNITTLRDYTYIDNNSDILIISYGRLMENVYKAQESLIHNGIKADILKLVKIFPVEDDILTIIRRYKYVFVFEEVFKEGSIGQKLSCNSYMNGFTGKMFCRAINGFVKQASVDRAMIKLSLDSKSMAEYVKKEISDEKQA